MRIRSLSSFLCATQLHYSHRNYIKHISVNTSNRFLHYNEPGHCKSADAAINTHSNNKLAAENNPKQTVFPPVLLIFVQNCSTKIFLRKRLSLFFLSFFEWRDIFISQRFISAAGNKKLEDESQRQSREVGKCSETIKKLFVFRCSGMKFQQMLLSGHPWHWRHSKQSCNLVMFDSVPELQGC